jgi:hypothetical protein
MAIKKKPAPKKQAAPKPKITTPDNTAFGLTDIGFQNAAANAASTTGMGGFTPVVPTGTITLANGDVMEVASGRIIGPVDYTLGKPGDFTDPSFKPYAMDTKPTTEQTNQIWVLIAKLKAVGIPASTADRAGAFFTALQDDGIDDVDNMIDIFLNAKSYKAKKTGQEIASPYYTDFGKFNEGLTSAKPSGVLVPWVLGLRETVKRYDTNGTLSLFSTDESIQKFLKNGTQPSTLDANLNAARLAAVTADPVLIDTLTKMNYIKTAADLTSFFASPDLGQKQLELNRNSAAFGIEAVRRAKVGGINLDSEYAKQQAAELTRKGYSEAQIAAEASRGYSRIARDIMPTVKVSGIYQGAQAASAGTIQKELQQEEFMDMDSERFNILAGQESASFRSSSSFLNRTSLPTPTLGQI